MDITTIISPNNAKTVENKGGSNTVESNAVRLNNTSAPIIEDWISDDESEVEPNDRTVRPSTEKIKSAKTGNPQQKEYKEKAVINSGCSRHMIGKKCYLDEYEDYYGRFVSFGDGKGRIYGKDGVVEEEGLNMIEAARTIHYASNKTPYELIHGRPPLIDFMKPFGCPVTILNNKDHLGKFDGKADEGYFVGYSVEMDQTVDIDSLTISMIYMPVVIGNQTNGIAGTKDNIVAGPKDSEGDAGMKPTKVNERGASDKNEKDVQDTRSESERLNQREMQTEHTNSTNSINTVSTPVSTAGPTFDNDVPSPPVNTAGPSVSTANAFKEHLFE
ncbi:retrovirus-related pol polyprotein from transposon TNT 1-94 [Tanacetum coccineum]